VTEFTPIASLSGGVLIGFSALLVLFLFGRVAGISGITSAGLLSAAPGKLWRLPFLSGLIIAPWLLSVVGLDQWGLGLLSQLSVSSNLPLMTVAGLIVGVGTALGSGCTSGHGVCGLGRLSGRSLVAVLTFMCSAAFTVWLLRHVI